MVTRLSASDASFYHLENSSTPMYVGTLSILRRPRNGLSYETLLATVEQRLPQIPRYRQKVRELAVGLARPVWIDDREFDITYHIRRSALPSPGSDAQLHDLIARLGSRPLDKSRPLWEMYLIEGLAKNRVAIYTKTHQALVNGMTALEIGHVIADRTQKPPEFGEDIWIPAREPSDARLLLGAIGDWVGAPGAQIAAVRAAVGEVATNAGAIVDVGRRFADVARTFARGTAPNSPLNATVSRNRRLAVANHRLEDYRLLRARYDCDVNDVVLAVVTGALRNWLLSRGEPVTSTTTVRAMAPNSVYPDAELDTTGPGQAISEVSPFLVDMPVGEGNAVVRLSQIAHATESHSTAASLVDARTIVTLSGFAPPTLHAMGIRVATSFSARQFNLLITNVPGAQMQMYVAGT
jgi:WS/DGAT/MGAT family acyltransferase